MSLEKLLRDPEQTLIELDRIECAESFASFVKAAWKAVNPGQKLLWNWHLDIICDHLERAYRREFRRIVINVPPRTMKSWLVNVFYPVWTWIQKPSTQFNNYSHSQQLATRDSVRARRLLKSDWFQRRWGDRVTLTGDQNEKMQYETDQGGHRVAFGMTSSITGAGGDIQVIDDPHDAKKAQSEVERQTVIDVIDETLPSRFNDYETGVMILIMQRLHQNDATGHVLSKWKERPDFVHLCFPMEYDPKVSSEHDIRKEAGELLWPERWNAQAITLMKDTEYTSYAWAGQFQQTPVPRDGGACKRHWFEVVEAAPANIFEGRGWDLAASETENAAYTAGVKIARDTNGIFYVKHVTRQRLGPMGVEQLMVNTAMMDGANCPVSFPQDPGQAGKSQAQYLASKLAGFNVTYGPETGDKLTRGLPFAAQAEAGNVKIVRGDWNEAYLDEICTVPNSHYWDQWDATSRAFDLVLKKQADYSNMQLGSIGKESVWRRV